MADITALAGVLTSLKAAKDIAQAMIGLRDAAAFQTKVIEFQSKILDAQSGAMAAQDERSTLLQRISELEKEVAGFKAWDAEKQRYELKAVYPGAFAYVLKADARGTEPPHWLCTSCYQRSKKSFLQNSGRDHDATYSLYRCPDCKATIRVHYKVNPGTE